MNYALLRYADKLALALKQMEQAGRNLRQVHIWADRQNRLDLSRGTQGLIESTAKVTGDLHTLVGVLRAQANREPSEVGQ